MLRIGICDDEGFYLDSISEIVDEYCKSKRLENENYTYYDGIDLINSCKKFDIVFLDIEMDVLDGIETAQKIRETDMNVPIVYITGYSDYWRRAYSVHAFQFIEKPIRKEQIFQVMDDFYKMIQCENDDKILLITDDGVVTLKYSEIYYFYIEKKKSVNVYTVSGKYLVKENLADIYEKLQQDMFYMPHRCCIINLRFVSNVINDFDIVMENGDFLPLAQKKKDEFLRKLSQQFVNNLKGKMI